MSEALNSFAADCFRVEPFEGWRRYALSVGSTAWRVQATKDILAAIDQYTFCPEDVRIIVGGEGLPGQELSLICSGKLREFMIDCYGRSCGIVVNGIDRFCPTVRSLKRELSAVLRQTVHANCYIAPADSRGANLHVDEHDVIVLQVWGRKVWTIVGNNCSRDTAWVEREVVLGSGDALFLRRGIWHNTRTGETPSVHITFGLNSSASIRLRDGYKYPVVGGVPCIPTLLQLDMLVFTPGGVAFRMLADGYTGKRRLMEYAVAVGLNDIHYLMKFLGDKTADEIQWEILAGDLPLTARNAILKVLVKQGCALVGYKPVAKHNEDEFLDWLCRCLGTSDLTHHLDAFQLP